MDGATLVLVVGVLVEDPDHPALPDLVGPDDDVDRAGRELVGSDGPVDELVGAVVDLDRELGPVDVVEALHRRVVHLADRHLHRRRALRVVEDELGGPRDAREDVRDRDLLGDRDVHGAGGGVGRAHVRAGEQRRRADAGHGGHSGGGDRADDELALGELLEDVQGGSLR